MQMEWWISRQTRLTTIDDHRDMNDHDRCSFCGTCRYYWNRDPSKNIDGLTALMDGDDTMDFKADKMDNSLDRHHKHE
jgi:hypothetical protein